MQMRPCWAEIDTQALKENYRYLAAMAAHEAELLAVVKANAYGHSLALCAPAVEQAGARWLGVTTVEEGIAARALCPKARVLVISGIFPGQAAAAIQFQLTPSIWESWQLEELEAAAREAKTPAGSLPVHLEIDTGMSRQGVGLDDLGRVFPHFGPDSPLRLEGVMTHLFAADEADGRVTEEQMKRVDETLGKISAAGLFAEWLNVGASAALLAGQAKVLAETAARHGMKAMMRPGLALYGIVPRFDPAYGAGQEPATLTAARAALKPVLAWKSAIVGLRSIPAGASVGYNGTFVASEPMRVALVAVGYADGLDRKLGNHFGLLVRGRRAPLIGRVSMDQVVIDITEIAEAAVGDEVVLIGSQGAETITAFDHADLTGTIPWEVFTRLGGRVARRAV
jgi:alanine racemase